MNLRHIVRPMVAVMLVAAAPVVLAAQRGRGAGPAPPQSAQTAAPIDLTGYWVSIVNEDWRWRMVTPKKGDYSSIANLMTAEARKVADGWDASQDGSCLAYGAAALMRLPTRLHITWENENALKVETDAGVQTRRFTFDKTIAAPAARSLQGVSIAEWERPTGRGGGPGGPPAGPPGPPGAPVADRGGNLKVVTTHLSGGWLRKNGVPYSENTTLTEYYDRFPTAGGEQWLVVTTVVSDPTYLNQEFVTSSHFRREPDGAKWDPMPCRPAN
jgi:hypothetical protein